MSEYQHSAPGRWLASKRFPIAAGIALAEVIAVWTEWSRVVLIVVSIPIILFYIFSGRTLNSDAGRQLSWIAAAAQTFAILFLILWSFVVHVILWIVVAALAVIALIFLYADRPGKTAKP